MSFRVTPEIRQHVEALAAQLTLRTGRRHSLTDVIEQAITLLVAQEKRKGKP